MIADTPMSSSPAPEPSTPESIKKAKLRLETVCLLLAERTGNSQSEQTKKKSALSNVMEELVCSLNN